MSIREEVLSCPFMACKAFESLPDLKCVACILWSWPARGESLGKLKDSSITTIQWLVPVSLPNSRISIWIFTDFKSAPVVRLFMPKAPSLYLLVQLFHPYSCCLPTSTSGNSHIPTDPPDDGGTFSRNWPFHSCDLTAGGILIYFWKIGVRLTYPWRHSVFGLIRSYRYFAAFHVREGPIYFFYRERCLATTEFEDPERNWDDDWLFFMATDKLWILACGREWPTPCKVWLAMPHYCYQSILR
jgi:hypothetical protein